MSGYKSRGCKLLLTKQVFRENKAGGTRERVDVKREEQGQVEHMLRCHLLSHLHLPSGALLGQQSDAGKSREDL